jgi:Fe2+ or Zn2+ uptake regulation protein
VVAEIEHQADQFDFAVRHASVEVTGMCHHCRISR